MDRRTTFLQGIQQLVHSGRTTAGLRGLLGADTSQELERLVARERAVNPPRVAVIGKAGVGKTTTISNLFSVRMHTSHALRGTSQAQHQVFELRGGGSLQVVDMPGLGEGIAEDVQFEEVYRRELPAVDVVLYVLQADERLLGEDQRILDEVVIPALRAGKQGGPQVPKQLVVGLNKVDLIEPRRWNGQLNHPEEEQAESIRLRCEDIARRLGQAVPGLRAEAVNYYSAELRYRLDDLLLTLVGAAGKAAWKLPLQTADPFELAAPEVREFVRRWRAQNPGQ